MNQDSEKDRFGGSEQRRDGEPRSSGRRDDGPRFNRDTHSDRPRFTRSNDNPNDDRRGRPESGRPEQGRPNRDSGDSAPRPRFNRDDTNRDDKPRFNRSRNDEPQGRRPEQGRPESGRPEQGRPERPWSRDNNKPSFNRDDSRSGTSGDRRPRFDQDRNDRPGFNRHQDSGDARSRPAGQDRFPRNDKPRFDRNNDRPNDFNRSGNRFADRNDERPRFNRDDRPSDAGSRPRFDRNPNDRPDNDRPRFDRNRNNDRPDGDRPRFDRNRSTDRPDTDRPRFNRDDTSRDDKPRFDRDRTGRDSNSDDRRKRTDSSSRVSRDDKPGFKRVGGFNREADERNNDRLGGARFGSDRNQDDRRSNRPTRSRTDNPNNADATPRFSSAQRKDSGDRRTGNFSKAPNYNLEQLRTERAAKPRRTSGNEENDRPKRQPSADNGLTRLNRYIANSGVCSRREADELIARGDISVNGKVVTEMGYKVKDGDTVKYGTKVLNPERFVYVLLNKPKDYITTTEDPEERKTVMELVADAGNFRMYPVGRLDRNTTGLLLLTNDGELADKLTHPSNNIRKIYQVELDKPITAEDFETIQKGFTLEDGPIKPDALSIITPDAHVVGIEIHSGRNRIVRRIFEHVGYEVTKLDRTTYAGLTKKDLPRGKWRFLDPKEVVKLKYFN